MAGLRRPGARYAELIALEVKTGRAQLSAVQALERIDLVGLGALYVLVRSPEGLEDALLEAGLITSRSIVRGGQRDG